VVLACRLAPYLQGSSLGPTPTELASLFLSLSLLLFLAYISLSSFLAALDLMGAAFVVSITHFLDAYLQTPPNRPRGSVTTLGNKSSFSRGSDSRDSKSDTHAYKMDCPVDPALTDQSSHHLR